MMKLLLENWREYLNNDFLTESRQSIIAMGFPKIIASLFYELFPQKTATLMARWYKEYHNVGWTKMRKDKDWFRIKNWNMRIIDMIDLYDAAGLGEEKYIETAKGLELYIPEDFLFDSGKAKKAIKKEIKEEFEKDVFFYAKIIMAIQSGQITDLAPYKKLDFSSAKDKYDEKTVFSQSAPLKTYENGWKWVDVGDRCQLVGKLMSNCGSTGVMGMDPDRTMITLFDKNNKPHVVITYSPNENRISGDEGQASSKVKDKYHEYVLDVADVLGAEFDSTKTKSKLLGIKYRLKGITDDIERVPYDEKLFDQEFFKVGLNNQVYYGNDRILYPKDVIYKALGILNNLKSQHERVSGPLYGKDSKDLSMGEILASILHYQNAKYLNILKDKSVSTYKLALGKTK